MDSETSSALLFECGICMESKAIESINFLPCIHFICTKCHDKLIKNECPFCRSIITDEKEEDYDETENEYHDTNFEMLVMEEDNIRRRKRNKKSRRQEKKIIKLMENNQEVFVTIDHNTFRVLSNSLEN
jgi:hypothetical protein